MAIKTIRNANEEVIKLVEYNTDMISNLHMGVFFLEFEKFNTRTQGNDEFGTTFKYC